MYWWELFGWTTLGTISGGLVGAGVGLVVGAAISYLLAGSGGAFAFVEWWRIFKDSVKLPK